MRPEARNRVIRLLFQSGIPDRVARWNRKNILIVQYHGITGIEPHDQGPGARWQKHVSARHFLDQMRYLAARYSVVPLQQIVSHYTENTPLPDSPAAITIDDGYRNNYSEAYPILRSLGLPATIFVTTDFVSQTEFLWVDRLEYALRETSQTRLTADLARGRIELSLVSDADRVKALDLLRVELKRSPQAWRFRVAGQVEEQAGRTLGDQPDKVGDFAAMTWDQIAEMERGRLVTIGSHTVTHPILTHCSPDEVDTELQLSKSLVEQALHRPCELFCYPNGDFDSTTRDAVRRAGYTAATSSMRGLNDGRSDVFALRRIGVSGAHSLAEFAVRTSGTEAWLSGLKSSLTRRQRRERV